MKIASLFLALLCASFPLQACTGLRLQMTDGSMVHGRTLEFGTYIDTSVAVVPRNYSFQGTGLTYRSKYAAVGAIAFDVPALLDGLNEKGLAVGTFYFPGFAGYEASTVENQSRSLSPLEFPNWIVTQFATVQEVKEALSQIALVALPIPAWDNMIPPFHYIVYDQQGECIVIEPVEGKLIVHENPLGVMTNSPSFDWHMTNLRNYINLRTQNVPPLKVKGIELAPLGQGSGMHGLPGDFTPPSRFVRAAVFSYTAFPSKTIEEAILQSFHLLNQFDIPLGLVREESQGKMQADFTSITCVRDPQNLKYYYKTYQDQTIRMVDLKQFDLQAKQIKTLKTDSKQVWTNVSSDLK